MSPTRLASENLEARIRWAALAAAVALLPEAALPLQSYLAYGYLTLDAPLLVVLLLPCAILAFLATVHEIRPLWTGGWRQNAVALVGLTAFGLFFAAITAISFGSGQSSCYECGFAWFFGFAFPALLLEFVSGVTWAIHTGELKMEVRRHFRGPLPGIR